MQITHNNIDQKNNVHQADASSLLQINNYLPKKIRQVNASLTLPGVKIQALQALSVQALIAKNTYNSSCYNATDNVMVNSIISVSALFSLKLTAEIWDTQLQYLQQHNAYVSGISFADFQQVFVQDLSQLNSSDAEPFKDLPPNSLLVVSGNCMRKNTLNIPVGITVIGSDALIHCKQNAWGLAIPPACIYPDQDFNESDNTNKTLPIVYLQEANLIGVHIKSNNKELAIKAKGSEDNPIIIINNTITGNGAVDIDANYTVAKHNSIPTNTAIDEEGFTTEDSFTQGITINNSSVYLGDCSSGITHKIDSSDINSVISTKVPYLDMEKIPTLKDKLLDVPIFSPYLTKADWQNQLLRLQKANITLGGINANKFKRVDVVNLDLIGPTDMDKFTGTTPEDLIIVYGEAARKAHLPISGGATIMGSKAVIMFNGNRLKLDIPKAEIRIACDYRSASFPYHLIRPKNAWLIVNSDADVLTDASMLVAGEYPLVYLKSSNLIGVDINASQFVQPLVATGVDGSGSVIIADCHLGYSKSSTLFIHDCDKVTLARSECYGRADKLAKHAIFHNCENITCIGNAYILGLPTPERVDFFSRGGAL